MGAELLSSIQSVKPDWCNHSPLEMRRSALRWEAAVCCNGDWHSLSKAWQSLLQQPGSVTMKRGAPYGLLVIYTCPHASLGWRCNVARADDGTIFLRFPAPDETNVCVVVAVGHEDWWCMNIEASPPPLYGRPWTCTQGMHIDVVGKRQCLLQFAADRGLKGL